VKYLEQFKEALLKVSNSKIYSGAINEWVYQGEVKKRPGECLCGHFISKNLIINNKINGNSAIVGNCCIKKFGIEKKSFSRSRENYLNFALSKSLPGDERNFIKKLKEKLYTYDIVRMTPGEHQKLEKLAGYPYKWDWKW
jgi:hypothetical protein